MTRESKMNKIVFAIMLVPIVIVTYKLFYNQSYHMLHGLEQYASDMKAYILEMQGIETKYEFPYPIFFWLSAFFDLFVSPDVAVALATTFLHTMAIIFTKVALDGWLLKGNKLGWLGGCLCSIVAVAVHFASMLFPPEGIYLPGIRFRYVGVFSPNPFHNATYIAVKPFAILSFLWCLYLLSQYEKISLERQSSLKGYMLKYKDYVLFAVFLLLATMTKPSFTIILVGVAGLVMLYRMIANRFANWKQTFLFGGCFIPTFVDLLYQYKGVFVPAEGIEGGIGFCFGDVWALYCDNIPLAMALCIGFPIVVLLCNLKDVKKNSLLLWGWQIYLMGFAMAFFLYEKGFRSVDFNFSWGYMHGAFFLFFVSVMILLRNTLHRTSKWYVVLPQWGTFLWHVACGVYYFAGIAMGGSYY